METTTKLNGHVMGKNYSLEMLTYNSIFLYKIPSLLLEKSAKALNMLNYDY